MGNDAFYCRYVSFSNRFSSGTPVRVFASINYGNESSEVHDSASIWVEDVTTSRFKVCLVQGGGGSIVNTTIDWFAFQGSHSGVYHGETSFSLFTTGTKCNRVAFPQVWLYSGFFLVRHIELWQWNHHKFCTLKFLSFSLLVLFLNVVYAALLYRHEQSTPTQTSIVATFGHISPISCLHKLQMNFSSSTE